MSVEEDLVVIVWEGPGFEGVRQIIDIIISWLDIVVIRIRIREVIWRGGVGTAACAYDDIAYDASVPGAFST